MSSLYEQDFYAWANEQAALLRSGQLTSADLENIAEEIESMGRSEKRELISRLIVLMTHLLKWQFQPIRRGSSWETTIIIQRNDLTRHMTDNPSLKSKIDEAISHAYQDAYLIASDETAIPRATFPSICPWSFDQIMDPDFWPEHH